MQKAHAQNVEFPSPLKFGTISSYFTDHPTEFVEEPDYFVHCQHLLNAGDEIRVSCTKPDGTWQKATFEVLISKPGEVLTEIITEWRLGGLVKAKRRLVAEWGGPNHKWRVKDGDEIVLKGLERDQAEDIASGKAPIPKAA